MCLRARLDDTSGAGSEGLAEGVDGASSSQGEGVRTALDAYERTLRPLADKIQQGMDGEGFSDGVRVTAWQVRLLYWAAWFASAVRMDRLLGLGCWLSG
ncbi:hypothetical protein J3459_013600 [Metarhizium acridum]|nr:hypothetical protein J3459_013600 [Metarhizium acridum]